MKIIYETNDSEVAKVYVAKLKDDSLIEFVESVQPPVPQHEKWVLIVSTLKGCPVKCPICDAGGNYNGKLSESEILDQIAYMIEKRYSSNYIPVPKLKIQFARMGDPAFNPAVLDVLEHLPNKYDFNGLFPSISTVAPLNCTPFFDRLMEIKNRLYPAGKFQMQFSLHTTDEKARETLVPVKTLSFKQMGEYGEEFFSHGDRKVTLNFAAVQGFPLEPSKILPYFSPDKFIIKITPVNPTKSSVASGLKGLISPDNPDLNRQIVNRFIETGYDVILSIGDLRENYIGSNCGMYVGKMKKSGTILQ